MAENEPLFKILATCERVNIVASIVTNLLLTYMIVFRSAKEIGAYKYLLLAFAINDIYFPMVHYLTLPIICTYKDAFIMFSHGILTSRLSIMFFGVTFSQTMPLLVHLFIYRLVATKWPRKIGFYTGKTCFILIIITIAVQWANWFGNSYISYEPDKEIRDYVQPFLDEKFGGAGRDFNGALYYGVKGDFRWKAIIGSMIFNVTMSFFMSVIVFCSFSIAMHFRNANVQWSAKTKRLQQQLFYTLIAQTLIPILFVCFPCAGITNLPMAGFRVNVYPNLVSASLTIFPLLDAIIILFGANIAQLYKMPFTFEHYLHQYNNNHFKGLKDLKGALTSSIFELPVFSLLVLLISMNM